MAAEKKVHEPMFHIVKRSSAPFYLSVPVRIGAIILAFLACTLIVVLITGRNPGEFFKAMLDGALGLNTKTSRRLWMFIYKTAILLGVSIAITPAFKMKFWNIGANGQALIGALSTAAVMFYFGGKVPTGLLWVFMLAASLVSGMIWAVLPAIFKAKWNTNETLFTLMMNYIVVQAVETCITIWAPNGSGKLQPMTDYALPKLGESTGSGKWLLSIIVIAVVTALMFVYLRYSKHGYEISVVGESRNTALYIGINVKKVIIRTMLLSGAICGLVGFLIVGGVDCTVSPTDTIGSIGFTAILVSWMAKFNPLIMVLTSALISFLEVGTTQVATKFKIDGSISDIVTAVVLLFVVGCEFFINYKIMFRHSSKEVVQHGYH